MTFRPLFEEHGDVLEVALIRDWKTGEQQVSLAYDGNNIDAGLRHRGCRHGAAATTTSTRGCCGDIDTGLRQHQHLHVAAATTTSTQRW